jgi:23S rRNA (uridine2552-2'-O)-methyltransferase
MKKPPKDPDAERVPGKRATTGTPRKDSGLSVRVKSARGRTVSQQKWLSRQLNDPYVARARKDGYRTRAAYKLIEIDDKYRFLKPGQRVVDLGCAPGGWLQVAASRIGLDRGDKAPKTAALVGIDLLPVDAVPGAALFELDFMADDAPDKLKEALGGEADVVLSDMAANTTGHKQTDHLRIIGLAEAAAEFAGEIMRPGGAMLMKLFQGGETGALVTQLKRDYAAVRHVKPAASRADSSELYVLATGFRGRKASEGEEEG